MRIAAPSDELRRAGAQPHEEPAPPAFEILDALGGAASLVRRSATLDGSVPMRVAQACVPLLEGNAFGFQVLLRGRFEVERSLGRWSVCASGDAEALTRAARAALPVLSLRGLLSPPLIARLGAMWPADPRPRRALTMWTGLLARPRAGVRLRVSSTANRRPRAFVVKEAILDDDAAWHPIVLELTPSEPRISLGGEIATVAPMPSEPLPFEQVPIDRADDILRAHLDFYDASYFARKRRGEVVRAYKSLVRRAGSTTREEGARASVEIVDGGPASLMPSGPDPKVPDRLVFRNAVGFSARFDGQRVETTPDPRAMRRFHEAVRAAWAPVAARFGERMHEGAMLYFAKYFTPHPAGEPHFFVKPSSLVRTPVWTSLLIEGRTGAGWDVLRGVVEADLFHATPAVFQLWSTGETRAIAEGEPLLELFAIPRALLRAELVRRDEELAP